MKPASFLTVGIVAASILLTAAPVFAAGFQLKGVRIGSSIEDACGHSKVTDKFGDIIRENKESAPLLVDMRTVECNVQYKSFASIPLDKPALLMFLNDELILFKIEINGLSLENAVSIYRALVNEYGKPSRVKSGQFVTDTWKRNGQTLEFENLGRSWDNNDVTVILRDEKGFRTFQSRHKTNSAILHKMSSRNASKDTR